MIEYPECLLTITLDNFRPCARGLPKFWFDPTWDHYDNLEYAP